MNALSPLLADPSMKKDGHDFKSALVALDRMGASLSGARVRHHGRRAC